MTACLGAGEGAGLGRRRRTPGGRDVSAPEVRLVGPDQRRKRTRTAILATASSSGAGTHGGRQAAAEHHERYHRPGSRGGGEARQV